MPEGWERQRTLGRKVMDTEVSVDFSREPEIKEVDTNLAFIPTDGIAAAIWMERVDWRPKEWPE